MIVVRLRSGFGNQMFQYAFFLQLQKWYGKENVKLDVDTYHWKAHNGKELDKVFRLDLAGDSVPKSVSLQMADVGYSLKNRILRRLRGKKHHCYKFWKELSYEDYRNLPKDIYLEGYWTEERFFSEVADDIRKIYRFPALTDKAGLDMLHRIVNTCSVGMHVRRGDYAKYKKAFPMCPASYYEAASTVIRQKTGLEPSFFVFSDDLDWCRKNLHNTGKEITFVDINPGKNSYRDMMLMSNCRHQIIANSTFSWWAAWLNPNPDKIVIYPFSIDLRIASMPDSWIKIHYPVSGE
jgi:hypothetical protein